MTAPGSLDVFRADYERAQRQLTRICRTRGALAVSTLGPAGTSSHHAAEYLRGRLEATGLSRITIQLHPTFETVLEDLSTGVVPLALIPSAFRNATAFHWHPKVRLLFHFARPTPGYGLAARPGETPAGSPLRISSMSEVSVLYPDVCPPALRDRPVEWVPAASTMDAARVLAQGGADLALTNDNGRDTHGLHWLSQRPGAEIVWLLFTNLPIDGNDDA